MNYGEKISALRKSKGMTQEELGKVLNVTYQAVSKWERGESFPDFATMSQIAKYFQVPISYFEDGGESEQEAAPTEPREHADAHADAPNYIGMCTSCGKMLKEEEVATSIPKILCKPCAERQRIERLKQEQLRKKQEEEAEQKKRLEREHAAYLQRGSGIDAKLIVSLILAAIALVIVLVVAFGADSTEDRIGAAALIFLLPVILFAVTHAIFDFINELRDRDDGPDGYTRNLSLIVGAAFALVNIVLDLILYLTSGHDIAYIIFLFAGAILSFTFISQFMWGSIIHEIFTGGGFTFKLPGFIFSLSIDSILLMIIAKIFLGILSVLLFVVTTVLFALVAILGSVFTFIPGVIRKTVQDRNV